VSDQIKPRPSKQCYKAMSEIDPSDAPEGLEAVYAKRDTNNALSCVGCALSGTLGGCMLEDVKCTAEYRSDGRDVIYVNEESNK